MAKRALRIDIPYTEDVAKMFEKYGDYMERAYVVREFGKKTGKEHIQGIIEFSIEWKKPHKDMVNYINRTLKMKGSNYSFPEVKQYDSYMVYLCKGEQSRIEWIDDKGAFVEGEKPEVVYQKGFDESELDAFRNTAVEKQKEYLIEKCKPKKSTAKGPILLEWLTKRKHQFIKNGVLDQMGLYWHIQLFFRNTLHPHDTAILNRFYNLAHSHFSPIGYSYRMMRTSGMDFFMENVKTGFVVESLDDTKRIENYFDEYDEKPDKELISIEEIVNDDVKEWFHFDVN